MHRLPPIHLPVAAHLRYGEVPLYPTSEDFHNFVSKKFHDRCPEACWQLEAIRWRLRHQGKPLNAGLKEIARATVASIRKMQKETELEESPTKTQNRRWGPCPHCGASGWDVIGQRVSGLFDHDRPDGRTCQQARKKIQSARSPSGSVQYITDPKAPSHIESLRFEDVGRGFRVWTLRRFGKVICHFLPSMRQMGQIQKHEPLRITEKSIHMARQHMRNLGLL